MPLTLGQTILISTSLRDDVMRWLMSLGVPKDIADAAGGESAPHIARGLRVALDHYGEKLHHACIDRMAETPSDVET